MDAVAPARHRLVTWHDPADLRRRARGLTGLDVLHRLASGQLPPPPVAELVGFRPTFVSPGLVVFAYEPREEHYNPLGTVHGGVHSTLLDTACGCSVHTTLGVGEGYTSLDLTVKFLRPATVDSARLRAVGSVIQRGRRTALAEAKLYDAADRLVAYASSSCLIFG